MMKKEISRFAKLFITAVCMAVLVLITGNAVKTNADSAGAVTVHTAKELKAAIGRNDVSTIVLNTAQAVNITIKSSKAAKTKSLIIDAPDADIVNKAVFADIDIKRVKKYTEKVSGNNITYRQSSENGIIIAAKKKVDKLTVSETSGYFPADIYLLRKGAKIKAVEFVYTGGSEPVTGTYDKSKRKFSLKFVNPYDCTCTQTIKLDKNGRIVRSICKSDGVEFAYDYTYVYDTNGNIIKSSGNNNEDGPFENTYEYSEDGRLMKAHLDGMSVTDMTYAYDKKGRTVKVEQYTEDYIDSLTFWVNVVVDYKYNKNGKLASKTVTDTTVYKDDAYPASASSYDYTYTYNSEGLMDQEVYHAKSDYEDYYFTHKYEYNSTGYLIKEVVTYRDAKDDTETVRNIFEYEYDENGNLID